VLRRLEQKVPANENSAPMKQPILDMLRERTRLSFPVEEPEATLESLLAACGLLLELASVDGTFSDEERKRILAILRDEYQMFVGDAEELMNLAEQVLRDSEDDSEFTRIINEHYSAHEKLFLVELLWRIVFADGTMDSKEEALLERVAKQLDIPKKEIVKASRRTSS
jgi:uncharacterized tellurite resistance protein B-like protein